jgi:hypothetical protein
MKTDKLFSEIYRFDSTSKRYLIEIGLDQYTDIFNVWDPAPFKRRELDPDLITYLEGSSEEISLDHAIELHFMVPPGSRKTAIEGEVCSGLKTGLNFKMYLIKKEFKQSLAQILRCLILGLIFFIIGKSVSLRVPPETYLSILSDALFIGGWVFIWEAVSIFFFTDRELLHRYRIYKRLRDAPVTFQEVDVPVTMG